MDAQVQVAGQITSKPTNNGGTKFTVPLSNGQSPSTFDAALATQVSQFGSQVFTARIESKPNPRGGNPYLNLIAVAGPGQSLPPEIPAAGTPITPVATPFVPGVTPTAIVAEQPKSGGYMSPEDKTRITKLAVIGTAYAFVASHAEKLGLEFEEAVSWADQLALKLYTDARSHEPGAIPQQAAPQVAAPVAAVPADPQAVAAFVAQEAGSPVVQVGAEGVTPAAETSPLPWSTN